MLQDPERREKRLDQVKASWHRQMEDPDKRRIALQRTREWKQSEEGRKWQRQYQRNRLKTDIQFYLRHHISARMIDAIEGRKKSASTVALLGCTIPELKSHLESLFALGMTWDNRGQWHIDHIRPCASFDLTDPLQQRQCFNFRNLQPLWAIDNYRKGNRIMQQMDADAERDSQASANRPKSRDSD